MNKCPKCGSNNIEDQGLTYNPNSKNPTKYLHKCKDCGNVFHIEKEE